MTDSEKLDLILSEMQGMKKDIEGIHKDIDGIHKDINGIHKDVDGIHKDIDGMHKDIEDIGQKVTKIDLTIENEIRTNIQRVAEGHLDLSRNMHEVMRPNNEIEMLAIKVRMLETDVRELKQKIS